MLLAFVSQIAHSQEIAISFYQGGVLCEGRTASNKYVLGCQNQVCTFDASYSRAANGTIIMNVYNPNKRGFIPATYHIYPNNTLAVYANGYQIATGRWQYITEDRGNPSFRGNKTLTVHQEGNSRCTTTVTAKKVAGTSNQWDIYKGSTYITRLNGIGRGTKFYIDGFGTAIIN